MKTTCGFIGCGNMGGALAQAVRTAHPDCMILLFDTDNEKAKTLANTICGDVCDLPDLLARCDTVFLGVKPQVLPGVLTQIGPMLAARQAPCLLVSMAAGVPIASVAEGAGYNGPVIRIMPNTPVRLGAGMVAAARSKAVSDNDMARFMALLAAAGRVEEIQEELMDAVCALSGSGPAFVYWFAECLARGGEACGFTGEQAVAYAAQTILGAARMMLETGQTPQELRKAVCSPGGTTLAGLTALQTEEWSRAVEQAVLRAKQRAGELSETK